MSWQPDLNKRRVIMLDGSRGMFELLSVLFEYLDSGTSFAVKLKRDEDEDRMLAEFYEEL